MKSIFLTIAFLLVFVNSFAGPVTFDIGKQSPSFGSSDQAAALNKLMAGQPRQSNYQITYTTTDDVVIFGCDLDKDVIARIHQKQNGHGTMEKWNGHVLYRIKNAANGGSLSDTPNGKSPGSFQQF